MFHRIFALRVLLGCLLVTLTAFPHSTARAADAALLGWNNLGMHCMDSDYSVFSILPPYNTVEAQLLVGGKLVRSGTGYTVTYEAVADPDGSFNSTAMGKGNFYTYAAALFGATLAPEMGLAGWGMPGTGNPPQAMLFETTNHPAAGVVTTVNWWRAEGIPLAPYDDAHKENPYPLMRLIARNSANQTIATSDVVLPVSDEMDCRVCHASGTRAGGRPAAGWVWDGLPERDYRLNILRLHDEQQFALHPTLYSEALAVRGFNARGLYVGVVADAKPVLCAACHASEALGAPSYGSIPPLTASVHSRHAQVIDPVLGISLNDSANRAACYRCHPGSTTRCLRGAMGGAIAADGSMEMQCQSCHGNMSTVGSANRVGWFMEPNCQSCHTGTATSNNGQIRYTSAFEASGTPRVAVNQTFATQPNTPATGLSLYRFSSGHGGLQCSACHGSTHAEFPSTHRNDNVRNVALQGHAGVMIECTACHTTMPNTTTGGPHGMHPIGASWISGHPDLVESGGAAQCAPCHGTDYRGTVLSRAQANRTLSVGFEGGTVTLNLFRGAMIGCYTCHNGPSSDHQNTSAAPSVSNVSAGTSSGQSVAKTVTVTPAGTALRIISQPAHGSVGVNSSVLTYFPDAGYVGGDTFTYAAWDGSKNSGLGTASITVTAGGYSIAADAYVPPSYPAGWPAAFGVVSARSNTTEAVSTRWDFGDGSAIDTNQFTAHAYTTPGTYSWVVSSTVGAVAAQNSGSIVIGDAVLLEIAHANNQVVLAWPSTLADTLLETTTTLGSAAPWTSVSNVISTQLGSGSVTLPAAGNQYFRLRRPW